MSENVLLKPKINELQLIIQKNSTDKKSLNMLLGNQLYANNRKGLGFDKVHISKQSTNHIARKRSVTP